MAMPQVLVQNIGGRLGVYLPQRPASAPTITLRDPANGVQGSVSAVSATLDSVSTTLSSAVTRGDGAGGGSSPTGITVASGTSIVAGRDYVIGSLTPETDTGPSEVVRVASISGTTVVLQWPLLYNHATSSPFYSTLATYSVAAADADATFRNGHAQWTWTDRASLVQHTFTRVEVAIRPPHAVGLRRYPHAVCTEADLFDRSPSLYREVAHTFNLGAALSVAMDQVLMDIELRTRARALVGSDSLTDATAWFLLAEIADMNLREPGQVSVERDRYNRAIEHLRSTATVDEDQDGHVERHEGARRGIRLDVGP